MTVINSERPDTEVSKELIAELDTVLNPLYPPESRHGYSVEKLIRQGVEFFVIYQDGVAAGCGGVQFFDDYAELKRMYVRPQFRGLGLGKRMVAHLSEHAAQRGIKVLRLETGISQTEAIGLYKSFGFEQIPSFGDYFEDPLSLCFEKKLA